MSQKPTLSLSSAILINTNIMLGTGIFVNTVVLAKYTGILGSALYVVAGILMFPLVASMAQQTQHHTKSSFYNFGKTLSPYCGFISTWTYFIGKLASAALGIHVFTLFLLDLFPVLSSCTPFSIEVCLIGIFMFLNTLNVKTGKNIQTSFMLMKCVPFLFTLIAGLWSFDLIHISAPHIIWAGLPAALPLTLFSFIGFEATCSLSSQIKNPQVNGPRAIYLSFGIVMFVASLYQFLYYGSLGRELAEQINYIDAFPALINITLPSLMRILDPLFSLTIGISALGGAYGILYSNSWNLFTLAEKNHLIGSSYFAKLNTQKIPLYCVIAEGVICFAYLFLTQGSQIPLQYTAVLGCITAHTVSVVGLFHDRKSYASMFGIATCIILAGVCINGFIHTSFVPLMIFGVIVATGTTMFLYQNN